LASILEQPKFSKFNKIFKKSQKIKVQDLTEYENLNFFEKEFYQEESVLMYNHKHYKIDEAVLLDTKQDKSSILKESQEKQREKKD